jgi:hypothetical protein
MLAGKLDGGLQEGRSNAGSPMPAVDHETRHPPDSGIILIQHSRESPVAAYSGKRATESYSGPSDTMIIDESDEPGRIFASHRTLTRESTSLGRRNVYGSAAIRESALVGSNRAIVRT